MKVPICTQSYDQESRTTSVTYCKKHCKDNCKHLSEGTCQNAPRKERIFCVCETPPTTAEEEQKKSSQIPTTPRPPRR